MFRLLIALFVLLWSLAAPAQPLPPGGPGRENAIETALIAESASVAPGDKVTLAIRMRPDAGWHGYWLNPGEAGVPDRWVWRAPEGVEVGALRYPVPHTLVIGGIMNHVYEGEYALLADVTIPAGATVGTRIPVSVEGDWLACTDEICVPESGTLSTELTVGAGGGGASAQFDAWRAALPRPLGSEARFELADGVFRLAIPYPAGAAAEEPYFFALTDRVLDYGAEQRVGREGDWLVIEVPGIADAATMARVEGLLSLGGGQGLTLRAIPGPVPQVATRAAGAESASAPTGWRLVLLALGGAILGGLLLNIMPCVFPILSLKALSLARAGSNGAEARRDALAYSAGVILVCVALGGALLALRASGAAVGWAFQLQDPRIVLLLLLLVTAIALNLLGLFELPGLGGGQRLAGRGGATGSFWTGALAAFVATPCTGPFMAAALGAALVLPAFAALAIFAGLGLGLALPFLAIGFIPALRRLLPKPGPWMARFRRLMSIPMFLTALALVWLLWRLTGEQGLGVGLVAIVAIGAGLLLIGRLQRRGGGAWRFAAPALAGAALFAVLVFPAEPIASRANAGGVLAAEPFSTTRLAELRAEGRPVFAYFTADWCITCKANEAAAIERAEVAKSFEQADVAVLVGDWTSGDPAIGRFLESHGRSGVPLYLWYAPGEEPEILPQVLTPGALSALAGPA